MSDSHSQVERRVVSAFPATGKTYLAQRAPGIVDTDSSAFSWAVPGVRHPNWPTNYITHIRELLRAQSVRYVLVSTHAEVRAALVAGGISFALVVPSVALREEYRERMERRGSPPRLIDAVMDMWDTALADCAEHDAVVVLRSGQYLSDLIAVPESSPAQEGVPA